MTVLTSSAFSTLNLRIDVVERDGIGSVQAEHDEVRFLADFERSDLRLHVQRARASDRGHPSACSALNATGSLRVTFCSLAAKSSSSTIPRSLLLPVAWNRTLGGIGSLRSARMGRHRTVRGPSRACQLPHTSPSGAPRPSLFGIGSPFGVNSSEMELMQYRSPVGGGPSGKTCPWCAPQRAQTISVRIMP